MNIPPPTPRAATRLAALGLLAAALGLLDGCCKALLDDAGTYHCIARDGRLPPEGRCTASAASCEGRLSDAREQDRKAGRTGTLRCVETHTTAYYLRWASPYGASEGWWASQAACEGERARLLGTRGVSNVRACKQVSFDESGRKAH
jgi:hypothetical protein